MALQILENTIMKELADDTISSLPDEILFHIISLLPFESARQTIFLSTRWKLLWNRALVQHGTKEDVASAVSGFITNFDEQDPTRNTRKLKFHFGKGSILLATIAPNNKLHMDFSTGKQEFPSQFGLQLEINHKDRTYQSSSSTFFVKTLSLISVTYLTNELVSTIISKFQFLENLKITECNGLQSLKIDSDTKLISLTIFDCPQLKSIHIRSYKLKTFRYRGLLPWFRLEYHFNLVDCMLDCRQGPGYSSFKSSDFDPALLTIKNAKVLTLCKWTFEAFICPSLSSLQADFQFYNLKELWWIDYSKETYNSDVLISFLKLCPSLERLFITIDPEGYCMASAATCSLQAGMHTQLRHLEVVKMEGFTSQENEIIFAKRLRDVVTMEPLILATSDGVCWRSLVKVPPDQPKQKSRGNFEIVEDANDLCPKHAHMVL